MANTATRNFIKEIEIDEFIVIGNYEENLLNNKRTVNNESCVDDCYITNVTRILYKTNIRKFIETDSNIINKVTTEFEAEIIALLKGDYIYCTIISASEYRLIGQWNDMLNCNIKYNPEFKGITLKDQLPIVINNINYYGKKIIAHGEILITTPLFYIATTESVNTIDKLPTLNNNYLWNVIKKCSVKDIKQEKSGKYSIVDENKNDKLTFTRTNAHNKLIIIEKDYVDVITKEYVKLVTFLNSFDLEKKIKTLYDNIDISNL